MVETRKELRVHASLARFVRLLGASVGIWTAIALVFVYQFYQNSAAQGRHVTWVMVVHILARDEAIALLTPAIYLLSSRYDFRHGTRLASATAHVIGFCATTVAFSYLRAVELRYLPHLYDVTPTFTGMVSLNFRGQVADQVWTYLGIVGVTYAIHYSAAVRQRELNVQRLRAELAQSKLQILKLQLQPHFLFNALNGISALMSSDIGLARTMMAELSDLLRMAFKNADESTLTLGEELNFVRAYLQLQKMRLQDRLTAQINVPAHLLSAPVPCMVLQPIIENAIRHGVEKLQLGGQVIVTIRQHDSQLRVRVLNDGPSLAEAQSAPGTGVGLGNTRERLRRLYGSSQDFLVEDRPEGGVVVQFDLPLARSGEPAGEHQA